MKILAISMLILMLMPLASAYNLVLNLKDSDTKDIVTGQISYTIYSSDKIIKDSTYYLLDGTMSLNLDKGEYYIEFKYDNILLGTGKDLYSKMSFDVYDNFSTDVYMLPVGSVQGIVLDNKGKFVANATIIADCVAEYGIQGDNYANYLGTFSYNYIPTRNCRIIARYDGMTGYTDIFVKKGELQQITIVLDKEILSKKYILWGVSLGTIMLILLAYIVFHVHKKKIQSRESIKNVKKTVRKRTKRTSDKKENTQAVEKDKTANKRSHDIIQTLRGREKTIIQFMLENDNVPMSKIYYGTGIPKTSLVRILDDLESRNILKMEKIGKMKRVSLTEWFKEEK